MKKKTTKRKVTKLSSALPKEEMMTQTQMDSSMSTPSTPTNRWPLALGLAALAIVALLLTHKNWLMAAIVNNKPIFSWELNAEMSSRFAKQTLEQMIGETLINQEADKAGVTVTQADIDAKEDQTLKSLGAQVKLEDLLKFQGMSRADFDKQIRIQLLVQKILEKNAQITEGDIDGFISTRSATLMATEPAQMREEARQALIDERIGPKVQEWFTNLKDQAKIVRFL